MINERFNRQRRPSSPTNATMMHSHTHPPVNWGSIASGSTSDPAWPWMFQGSNSEIYGPGLVWSHDLPTLPTLSHAAPGAASGTLIRPTSIRLRPLAPPTAPQLSRPIAAAENTNPVASVETQHVISMELSDEVVVRSDRFPVPHADVIQNPFSLEELPKIVAANIQLGSSVTSMDFHPSQPTVLLVGTNIGDIIALSVTLKRKSGSRNSERKDRESSMIPQSVSVNRVLWSSKGDLLGVAYSKNFIHLFEYATYKIMNPKEIEAHNGGVNDIAFCQPNGKLCIITCGDGKLIKVWIPKHASFGMHLMVMKRLCLPYARKKTFQQFFSGINMGEDPYIVEWDATERSVRRSYIGLKSPMGMAQFHSAKQILVAGDDSIIKFWGMDNVNILTTCDANGQLPASPCIRFSRDGTYLAVSTCENSVKILVNDLELERLRTLKGYTNDASGSTSAALSKSTGNRSLGGIKSQIIDEPIEKAKTWELKEISERSGCCSLKLSTDNTLSAKD